MPPGRAFVHCHHGQIRTLVRVRTYDKIILVDGYLEFLGGPEHACVPVFRTDLPEGRVLLHAVEGEEVRPVLHDDLAKL